MVHDVQEAKAQVETDEEDWSWRLVRPKHSTDATLELSSEFEGLPDEVLTLLMHRIGKTLIQAGTLMLQSEIGEGLGGDDDFDDAEVESD